MKKSVVKKISKKKRGLEESSAMAPARVIAPPVGGIKRMLEDLELDEVAPTRVTRQKAKAVALTSREESPLHKDGGGSTHMDDGFLPMDEGSTGHMDHSPVAPTMDHMIQPLDVAGFSEQLEQHACDEGKLIQYYFFLLVCFVNKCNACMCDCLAEPK